MIIIPKIFAKIIKRIRYLQFSSPYVSYETIAQMLSIRTKEEIYDLGRPKWSSFEVGPKSHVKSSLLSSTIPLIIASL